MRENCCVIHEWVEALIALLGVVFLLFLVVNGGAASLYTFGLKAFKV